jgi:hypothetical protein
LNLTRAELKDLILQAVTIGIMANLEQRVDALVARLIPDTIKPPPELTPEIEE